jgi:hypothetical protein
LGDVIENDTPNGGFIFEILPAEAGGVGENPQIITDRSMTIFSQRITIKPMVRKFSCRRRRRASAESISQQLNRKYLENWEIASLLRSSQRHQFLDLMKLKFLFESLPY